MQYKLLHYLGILVLLTSMIQCTKCKQRPPYNTVDLDLVWEKEKPMTLDMLDLDTAKGLTCYNSTEKATYFLNAADGNCFKFTEDPTGSLQCQSIGSLTSFNYNKSFTFVAGPSDRQNLFFGTVNNNKIEIHKLEGDSWTVVVNKQDLNTCFTNCTVKEDSFVKSCSILTESGQQGYIFLKTEDNLNHTHQIGCLLFNAENISLKRVTEDSKYIANILATRDTYLLSAICIKEGKIFLGKGNAAEDRYNILEIKNDTLFLLDSGVNNKVRVAEAAPNTTADNDLWETFSLQLQGEFPIQEPIFTILNNRVRYIYRMSENRLLENMKLPEVILSNPNLVIPFSDKLYLITAITTTEEDNTITTSTVSYQAKLTVNTDKKPDSNS